MCPPRRLQRLSIITRIEGDDQGLVDGNRKRQFTIADVDVAVNEAVAGPVSDFAKASAFAALRRTLERQH
jgi:hypothetical protein